MATYTNSYEVQVTEEDGRRTKQFFHVYTNGDGTPIRIPLTHRQYENQLLASLAPPESPE